jgi:hypothetical protein
MKTVALTTDELLVAATVGVHRHLACLRAGSITQFDTGADWNHTIEGAAAELALAKHLARYWTGLTPKAKGDVGAVQVRQTAHANGHLVLRARDFPGNPFFVLITGANGRYQLIGWIRAHDGRRDEWRRNPNGYGEAFFVPQTALKPMGEVTTNDT